jgi:hypothetical protein
MSQPFLHGIQHDHPVRCEPTQNQVQLYCHRVDRVAHIAMVDEGIDELGDLDVINGDCAFVGARNPKVLLRRSF